MSYLSNSAFFFLAGAIAVGSQGSVASAQTVIADARKQVLGTVDACPTNNFSCIVRLKAPNGTLVRLGATRDTLFSIYEGATRGVYYTAAGCAGTAYIAPANLLLPEVPLIATQQNSGALSGTLYVPSAAPRSVSYLSMKTLGGACRAEKGKIMAFPFSTATVTFYPPFSVK